MTIPGEFETIDRQIAALQDEIDGCRRAITASRAVALAGATVLVLALTIVGALRTPTVVFAAVAAAIGGTVWLGASSSSLREAVESLAALDAVRERMIDKVAGQNGWRDLTPTVH